MSYKIENGKLILDDTDLISHGDLDLCDNTDVIKLPDNLQVGGYLDLQGTQIKELPDNLQVGGYLNLRGTQIKELPDNLQVGRSLFLEGTQIKNYPITYDCGRENRAIYLDLKDKNLIRIGCFKGTKEEAIRAIREKYTGDERDEYITKVDECFAMWDFEKDEFIGKKD